MTISRDTADRARLGGNPNLLINGDMEIWQRGISGFTATAYTADRWKLTLGTGAGASVARAAWDPADTPPESVGFIPKYYLSLSQSTIPSAGFTNIGQRIEDVKTAQDCSITLSFWAESSADFVLTPSTIQDFGTGGSADVSADGDPITILSSGWNKYTVTLPIASVTGKTIADADSYLAILLKMPATGTVVLRITRVKVEIGYKATPHVPRPFAEELIRCQRYFQKSYDKDSFAGAVTGPGEVIWQGTLTPAGTSLAVISNRFPVVMRAVPTATLYCPTTGNVNKVTVASGSVSGTVNRLTSTMIAAYGTSGSASNMVTRYHYIVDAEL